MSHWDSPRGGNRATKEINFLLLLLYSDSHTQSKATYCLVGFLKHQVLSFVNKSSGKTPNRKSWSIDTHQNDWSLPEWVYRDQSTKYYRYRPTTLLTLERSDQTNKRSSDWVPLSARPVSKIFSLSTFQRSPDPILDRANSVPGRV